MASASAATAARSGSLSLAGIAAVAFFAVVAIPRAAIPLIDGDVWWHIRAGEEVLRTGAVPRVDNWTLVSAGEPWVSQDWLSNVFLAAGYGVPEWGPTVLSMLFSLMVAGSLWLLWRSLPVRRPEIGWLSRIAWMAVGLTVAGPVIGVRVQVIDAVLAIATVVVLWRYLREQGDRVLVGLPIIALAWANLHAGWLLLFLLGGAFVVGEAADRALRRRVDPAPLDGRRLARVVGALVVALGAVAANPNGFELYAYPFETSAIGAHRDFLAEWSPPDVTTLPGQLFVGFVALGVVPAVALGWRTMRICDALMLGGLLVMAASAARFLGIVGPIGGAIVAITLAPVIARSSVSRRLRPTLSRMGGRPRTRRLAFLNLALASALVVAGALITLARVSPSAQARAIAEHMPVGAVAWILANDPGDRPFNTYSWGGYLGFHRPDSPVFIDGRSDVHGDAPIRAYADAISLRTDPGDLLDRYAIDHILFNTDHGFAAWLDQTGEWRRAYSDPLASVWVRREAGDD